MRRGVIRWAGWRASMSPPSTITTSTCRRTTAVPMPTRWRNLKAGYEADRWSVYAWGRNVFDEDYDVRGFFFGNEPPDVREQALHAARRAAAVRRHRPMGVPLMRTAIEISLYPLDADYIPPIKAFIDRLNTYPELQVTTNAMSTQIAGRACAPVRDPGEGNRDHVRRARPQGVRDEGARRRGPRLMKRASVHTIIAQLLATSPWEAGGGRCSVSPTCCWRCVAICCAGCARSSALPSTWCCSRMRRCTCSRCCRCSTWPWRCTASSTGAAGGPTSGRSARSARGRASQHARVAVLVIAASLLNGWLLAQ